MQPRVVASVPFRTPAFLTPERVVIAAIVWHDVVGFVASVGRSTPNLGTFVVLRLLGLTFDLWLARRVVLRAGSAPTFGKILPLWFARSMAHFVATAIYIDSLPGDALGGSQVLFSLLVSPGVPSLFSLFLGAAWVLLLLERTRPHRQHATAFDATDRTLEVCALWNLMEALFVSAPMAFALRMATVAPSAAAAKGFFVQLALHGSLLGVLALARFRRASRHRWFLRVQNGEIPGWRVRDQSPSSDLPALEGQAGDSEARTLVRVSDPESPYRDAVEEPVATVPQMNDSKLVASTVAR